MLAKLRWPCIWPIWNGVWLKSRLNRIHLDYYLRNMKWADVHQTERKEQNQLEEQTSKSNECKNYWCIRSYSDAGLTINTAIVSHCANSANPRPKGRMHSRRMDWVESGWSLALFEGTHRPPNLARV